MKIWRLFYTLWVWHRDKKTKCIHKSNVIKKIVVNIGDSEFVYFVFRWREQDNCFMNLRFREFTISRILQGTSEKTRKEKLLLMSWCPDTARIKKKMLYSSSFDALKKCLVGVQKYIQVCKLFSQWGQNHYEVALNINNVLTQNTAY